MSHFSAQLVQVITDTVEAFEKVKNKNDNETWKTLKNIEESNMSTSSAIARYKFIVKYSFLIV